jgi:hypothetical protein
MSKCCIAAVTAALPPVDDQRDPRVDPELGLVRVPELLGLGEHLALGSEGDELLGHGHLRTRSQFGSTK